MTSGQAGSGLPVATVVVNPTAGRGRAGRVLPGVLTGVAQALPGHRIELARTDDVAEARRACRRAVAEAGPADRLLVMGGDGMMHLGLNACAGTDVAIGLLPAGTGNDLCRGLGLPLRPRTAVAAVARGRTRRVDLARVERGPRSDDGPDVEDPTWVGSVVATGFDARVNRRANQLARPRGPLRYAVAALAELATFHPLAYRLTLTHPDGRDEVRELDAMLVAVANGGYFGGGMNIAPDARPDDGLLDLTLVHPVSRATLCALLPLMFSGAFVAHPAVEQLRVRAVEVAGEDLVMMGDGEELGAAPLSVTAVPRALTVLG